MISKVRAHHDVASNGFTLRLPTCALLTAEVIDCHCTMLTTRAAELWQGEKMANSKGKEWWWKGVEGKQGCLAMWGCLKKGVCREGRGAWRVKEREVGDERWRCQEDKKEVTKWQQETVKKKKKNSFSQWWVSIEWLLSPAHNHTPPLTNYLTKQRSTKEPRWPVSAKTSKSHPGESALVWGAWKHSFPLSHSAGLSSGTPKEKSWRGGQRSGEKTEETNGGGVL